LPGSHSIRTRRAVLITAMRFAASATADQPMRLPDPRRAAVRLAALLPPETAHRLAIRVLAGGWLPAAASQDPPSLAVEACGRRFANPAGIAAGFDKHAEAIAATLGQGAGFVEVGGVTPRPQAGNPRPRLFRLAE